MKPFHHKHFQEILIRHIMLQPFNFKQISSFWYTRRFGHPTSKKLCHGAILLPTDSSAVPPQVITTFNIPDYRPSHFKKMPISLRLSHCILIQRLSHLIHFPYYLTNNWPCGRLTTYLSQSSYGSLTRRISLEKYPTVLIWLLSLRLSHLFHLSLDKIMRPSHLFQLDASNDFLVTLMFKCALHKCFSHHPTHTRCCCCNTSNWLLILCMQSFMHYVARCCWMMFRPSESGGVRLMVRPVLLKAIRSDMQCII